MGRKPFKEVRERAPHGHANSPGYPQHKVMGVILDGLCHKHSCREILDFSLSSSEQYNLAAKNSHGKTSYWFPKNGVGGGVSHGASSRESK